MQPDPDLIRRMLVYLVILHQEDGDAIPLPAPQRPRLTFPVSCKGLYAGDVNLS